MEVVHGVDFVFKEINSRDASVNLSGSKQSSRCFVPNMFPFWVSMVDRDWSQGKSTSSSCLIIDELEVLHADRITCMY